MDRAHYDFAQSLRNKGQFHVFTNTHLQNVFVNASTNENTSSILAIKRVNSILTDHFRRKNMADDFFLFSEPFVHFTSV